MWNALFTGLKVCSAGDVSRCLMKGVGGAGPRTSVQVVAGYLHHTPDKGEEPEACPSCGGAEGRKHLGDAAEPRYPLPCPQFPCPPPAALRVPWNPISRSMLSSPRKVSQVYVPKSCINLPEWLVGPAGSTPRSDGHGQGLGCSQFPGQFCT